MTRPVTVEEILMRISPCHPFDGRRLFSGQKFTEKFDFSYTPIMEGMEKTYKIFYSLFIS